MIKHKLTALLIVFVAAILVSAANLPVSAITSTNTGGGNGFRISPLTTDLTINAGQTQTAPIFVENITGTLVNVQVLFNDFTASNNESGQPELLLNPNQYAPSHSLKRYLAPISDFILQPGVEKQINISITIPTGTAGGGYYGAVRFAPVSTSSGRTVTLSASVASLILVRVPGNVVDDLQLASLDVRQNSNGSPQAIFFSNKNLIVAARFQNLGNVQEQPFGKVLLESSKKDLASYEINNSVPRGNVLPGSVRMFTINLTNIGVIGKYTVLGNFGYGTNGQLLSGSTTFYVIPLTLVVAVIVIVLLILFLIFGLPRLIRSYNRRVIRRARHL
jgi:hypothetical protein